MNKEELKQKLLDVFDEFEHYFETSGYYSAFAGYGIKNSDYSVVADRIITLITPLESENAALKAKYDKLYNEGLEDGKIFSGKINELKVEIKQERARRNAAEITISKLSCKHNSLERTQFMIKENDGNTMVGLPFPESLIPPDEKK